MLKKGQLIRWVVEFEGYKADEKEVIEGFDPVYNYGIVMEVGSDQRGIVVYCYQKGEPDWTILYLINDKIEVLN